MPPERPAYLSGHYYHIYNRGAGRLPIFRTAENYYFVLRKMAETTQRFALQLIAYCLMPNHYHFLIRQDGEHRAGLLPQRVFNSYTKAYNQRYGCSGTLFEGHYHIRPLDDNEYLLLLCRYIHNNPVKAGLVTDPGDWPYSNYLECTGQRGGRLFDPEFVDWHFGGMDQYRAFVMAGLVE